MIYYNYKKEIAHTPRMVSDGEGTGKVKQWGYVGRGRVDMVIVA